MNTPAEIYAAEVAQRQRVKALSSQAAELRREAKACKVAVDAHGMRLKATELSKWACAARAIAKGYHADAVTALELAAAEMTQRMPPDFPSWGIMKTRGYVKLLEIVASNAKRTNPKLDIATAAHAALLRHGVWSDEDANNFGSLPKNPKSIAP